jgi:hypothetical protein
MYWWTEWATPVAFVPRRDKLSASPSLTGTPDAEYTIGISEVLSIIWRTARPLPIAL